MTLHGAEVLSCLQFVHLDFFRVSTDHDVAVTLVLEEVDAEDLWRLQVVEFRKLCVVNGVAELGEDGGRSSL